MIFGNLTKSSKNPPLEHDQQAVESAMSELGKQTNELLQTPIMERPSPRPELPQRRIIPHSRGASLDIVGHSASRMKQFHAKPVDDVQELLPQKAGFSYNEKPKENSPTIVESLPEITLQTQKTESRDEIAGQDGPASITLQTSQPANAAQDELEKPEPALPEKITYTPADSLATSLGAEEAMPMHPDETELVTAQKSDIFDTQDYHSELPAPTKQQKSYTWLYIVVAFLLFLMCGLIFLALTSQLPA